MSDEDRADMFTSAEAASLLGCSETEIRRRVQRGLIERTRLIGPSGVPEKRFYYHGGQLEGFTPDDLATLDNMSPQGDTEATRDTSEATQAAPLPTPGDNQTPHVAKEATQDDKATGDAAVSPPDANTSPDVANVPPQGATSPTGRQETPEVPPGQGAAAKADERALRHELVLASAFKRRATALRRREKELAKLKLEIRQRRKWRLAETLTVLAVVGGLTLAVWLVATWWQMAETRAAERADQIAALERTREQQAAEVARMAQAVISAESKASLLQGRLEVTSDALSRQEQELRDREELLLATRAALSRAEATSETLRQMASGTDKTVENSQNHLDIAWGGGENRRVME